MPIIEPIPIEELSPSSRAIIEGGVADGLYATPLPLQVFAYRTALLETIHAKRLNAGAGTLLGGRILELLRIRSAQLGECQPCMQSRKHDSITDDDVACLIDADHLDLDPQERMAIRFLDLLSADHHAIDADFYRELAGVFTIGQIVELGTTCAESMGLHRFIHTLDIFGTDPPVLPFAPGQVDASRAVDDGVPTGS
ncbi:carboxymuconolactone decarboxylase family protein [Aquihabitans sp. McL0605]|uniref:carboxymuconolactone decarboxylase family protein n=1 Tax=Aquihabitans sp. McL0605 TaxID=3415671 RepID=UPI003CE91170